MPRTINEGGVVRPFTPEEEAAADAIDAALSPERRLIRKSLIQERVNTFGKLGDAFAALQSQPLYFGRWFAPDYPNVFFDDSDMLTLLVGIGLTDEQIAVVTA